MPSSLPPPMEPRYFADSVLEPGLLHLAAVAPRIPRTADAARMLLAIAKQESDLRHRYQWLGENMPPGPARGWWQFENGRLAAIGGMLDRDDTRPLLRELCRSLHVVPTILAIWRAIEGNDMLATGVARLLLWSDPFRVPRDEKGAWECYSARLWRPGKPRPRHWPASWGVACAVYPL